MLPHLGLAIHFIPSPFCSAVGSSEASGVPDFVGFHLATCSSFPCTLTHPMGPSPFRDWLIRLPVFVFGSQPLLTSHYHPTSTIHHPPTTTNNEPLPPSASPPIFMSYICTYDNSPFASPVGSLVYSTLLVSRAAGKSMPNIYIYVYIHRMVWHK